MEKGVGGGCVVGWGGVGGKAPGLVSPICYLLLACVYLMWRVSERLGHWGGSELREG